MQPNPQERRSPRKAGPGCSNAKSGDQHSTSEIIHAFTDAMRSSGLVVSESVVADGELHRCHVEGDKGRTRNGWYVLFATPVPAGAFGTWRGDVSGRWRMPLDGNDGATRLTPAERAAIDAAIAAGKAKRAEEQRTAHRDAQTRALTLWRGAGEAQADHPYLVAKKVGAHGIRQHGDLLVIAMRDAAGECWSVQTIAADGSKRFLRGGKKRGLYFAIGGSVIDTLLIAEGYATGASLHEATAHPVAIAFDAGNLEPVAIALRAKYPNVRIIVCADDDAETARRTGTNPGIEKATAAARRIGGLIARPDFGVSA